MFDKDGFGETVGFGNDFWVSGLEFADPMDDFSTIAVLSWCDLMIWGCLVYGCGFS